MLECSDSDFEKMWPKVNKLVIILILLVGVTTIIVILLLVIITPILLILFVVVTTILLLPLLVIIIVILLLVIVIVVLLLVIIIAIITNRGVGVPSQWESSAPIVLMPALMKGNRFPFLQIAFANRCILNIILFKF